MRAQCIFKTIKGTSRCLIAYALMLHWNVFLAVNTKIKHCAIYLMDKLN